MAKKEKKELTPKQRAKKYNLISKVTFLSEFAAIFTPFLAIGIVNYDKYFIQYDGTKMSIAAVLAAILMGLAVWLVAKKKLTGTYPVILIGWAMVNLIFFLLGEIINDIAYIMLCGLIGLGVAYGLDEVSKNYKKKTEKEKKGIADAENERIKKAALDEIEKEEKEKEK